MQLGIANPAVLIIRTQISKGSCDSLGVALQCDCS